MERIQIFRIEHKSGIGPFNISDRIANKLRNHEDCYIFMLCMTNMPTAISDSEIRPVWNSIRTKFNVAIRFGASKKVFEELFIRAHNQTDEADTISEYAQRVLDHFKEHDFKFVEYEAKPYASSPHQIMFNPRTKKLKRVIEHIDQFSHFKKP